MKTYHGYRTLKAHGEGTVHDRCVVKVLVNGRRRHLRPRLDIRNHSPDGFNWGYGGSGPAQLALALVADCCGREAAIPEIYQRVKASIVASLPEDGWTLTEEQVRAAVIEARQKSEERKK